MATETRPQVHPPARTRVRWELWLGALVGAVGLSAQALQRGSAMDTLITWVILGSVLGALVAWVVDGLVAKLTRRHGAS